MGGKKVLLNFSRAKSPYLQGFSREMLSTFAYLHKSRTFRTFSRAFFAGGEKALCYNILGNGRSTSGSLLPLIGKSKPSRAEDSPGPDRKGRAEKGTAKQKKTGRALYDPELSAVAHRKTGRFVTLFDGLHPQPPRRAASGQTTGTTVRAGSSICGEFLGKGGYTAADARGPQGRVISLQDRQP